MYTQHAIGIWRRPVKEGNLVRWTWSREVFTGIIIGDVIKGSLIEVLTHEGFKYVKARYLEVIG